MVNCFIGTLAKIKQSENYRLMKVLWVHRKQRVSGNFSIESSFQAIKEFIRKEVTLFEWFSPFYSNGLLMRLRSVFDLRKNQNADIYHITGDVHFLVWACKKKRTVLTIHDCGFLSHPNPILRALYKYFWLIGPVKRATVVTCVSKATKNEILHHTNVLPGKLRIVPTIVDHRWIKSEKPFNQSSPVILQVGTKPNKNVNRLIEAIAGLKVRLWLVGELSNQQEMLLEKNGIEFENFYNLSFERLQELYQQCDVVAFCSTYEGFGMPIVEANITGRVVVSSNCSSMPEVAGNAAHLVNPLFVQSIKAGIEKVINDTSYRQTLIENGYLNANRFSTKTVTDQYLAIYRELYRYGICINPNKIGLNSYSIGIIP